MRDETRGILTAGMFAGLIGYATIVVLYAAINVATGHSIFYTPALFGSAIFYGLEDPSTLVVSPGPVLAYNAVHVLALLVLGLLTSWLVALAERHPTARFGVMFAFIFIFAHVYAALFLFARRLLVGGAWWQIGVVSLAAAIAMGWFIVRQHPLLRVTLQATPMGEEE